MPTALAVDLGSSSGRVLAGTLTDGRVDMREIHRFAHEAHEVNGELVWDVAAMWTNLLVGLRKAVAEFEDAVSVSVDTWGVDYVALDGGDQQVGPARAYRDARTTRTWEAFCERLAPEDCFRLSGNAPSAINTVNQLFAFRLEQPELAARVESVLMLPDYFAWRLSGVKGWSRTIASTSGLCTPGTRYWAKEVFDRVGIPASWVGGLSADRTVIGPCVVEGLERLVVVRGGAHDTACAVHALPLREDTPSLFLSCGSWSVIGAVTAEPSLEVAALEGGFTNEACTDGSVRPLVNLTGLWTLQECQRDWGRRGEDPGIAELVRLASEAQSAGSFDADDPRLVAPGAMVDRVRALLAERGAPGNLTQGQLARAVIESLAAKYGDVVAHLARMLPGSPRELVVVGGGVRNQLLLEFTRRRTGLVVRRGPSEASALGSMLAQFETLGHCDSTARASVIAATASDDER